MDLVTITNIDQIFHPENYSDYFPGKEKGYDLPTLAHVDMVLTTEELFDKFLREGLTI